MLKEIICVCATAIAGFQLYLNGDGQTITALFTLYGALFGYDVVIAIKNKGEK